MIKLDLQGSREVQRDEVLRLTLALLSRRRVPREEIVRAVGFFANMATSLTPQDIENLIAEVETRVHITMVDDEPPVIDHRSYENWLTVDRVAEIAWDRWDAYRSLLESKAFSPLVIDRIDKRAESILELAGDPKKLGSWARRGLVIGDVQSGKTANYLALFNKAADAGYKIVILFGGHTDKLRRQTQERVDEGFVGRDSRKLVGSKPGVFRDARSGVGFHKGFTLATSLTTWSSDFSSRQLVGTNLSAEAINGPVVFVIKKNKKIIENLIAWLHSQGSDSPAHKLDLPMLLLDDEADYASINTNNPDESPTAINAAMRDLLAVFSRNTYVGFTATPFANVFIDPEQEQDLFPRDYIVSLESPSNYFGPEAMFLERPNESSFISSNDDADPWLPYSHKSGHKVSNLPESLLDAVASFFLVNAIRDCRGAESAPRTMMINVSRFNAVQDSVFSKVSELVSEWRQAIKQGVGREILDRLERVFREEFSHQEVPWEQVQMRLASAVHHIEVKLVNSRTAASDDWDAIYSTDRARVIAVGGDVLSRGLTLEGLCVTYFRRKSVAYDTLMQMGRWFGYREGYSDVCKLWIDPEVAGWYSFIAEATLELRDQISRMRSLEQTPREFGLAVRRHPGSALMATALNKRRHSEIAQKVSLRDKTIESVRFEADEEINKANYFAAERLIRALVDGNKRSATRQGHAWWTEVPSSLVTELISDFTTAKSDLLFSDRVIEGHLLNTKAEWMKNWDLVVMSGDGQEDAFPGLIPGKKVKRAIYERGGTLYAGGQKLRLGGKGDEGLVLSDEVRSKVAAECAPKEPSDRDFRKELTKPLLIVYPIELSRPSDSAGAQKQIEAGFKRFSSADPSFKLIGIHIALPRGNNDPDSDVDSELVTWYVNRTWIEQNNLIFEDESDGEE